jgi:hypothetical protein
MRAGVRSAMTIAVLCSLLLVGALWGFSAVTAPFPGKADAPVCVSKSVAKGERVYPAQVVVSVYNAGTRLGLAGRTMALFTHRGFKQGDDGNAPDGSKVPVVQIWTTDPKNPATRLVESRLGPAHKVVKKEGLGAGVTVVVGDGFHKLVHGPRFVVARKDTTICAPPLN